jgi:predicted transcriptional regulator
MQKQLQVEYTELMDRCLDSIEEIARSPVQCELLFELLKNEATAAVLCYNLRLHPSIITSNLWILQKGVLLNTRLKIASSTGKYVRPELIIND